MGQTQWNGMVAAWTNIFSEEGLQAQCRAIWRCGLSAGSAQVVSAQGTAKQGVRQLPVFCSDTFHLAVAKSSAVVHAAIRTLSPILSVTSVSCPRPSLFGVHCTRSSTCLQSSMCWEEVRDPRGCCHMAFWWRAGPPGRIL